jgi:hypothetical protein
MDSEFIAIDEYFNRRRWSEVTLDAMIAAVVDINIVVGCMHERAFAYYLPALLLVGLRDGWQASAVMEGVLDRLADLEKSGSLRKNLTERQRAAVLDILNLYGAENPKMSEWVEKAVRTL